MKCDWEFEIDTQFYWALTKNIFRFGYLFVKSEFNAHTVDERESALSSFLISVLLA